MASKFGIAAAQLHRIAEPAGHQQPIDHRDPSPQPLGGASLLRRARRFEEETRLAVAWREDERRAGLGASKARGMIHDCGAVIFHMQRVTPQQRAVAIDLPALMQQPSAKPLAHRDAPKDEHPSAEKAAIASQIDAGRPPQPGAVEQDRFRRQEFEPAVVLDDKSLLDPRRRTGRAIDFLRRGAGDMRRRALPRPDCDFDPVAGDQSAGGRHQHRCRQIVYWRHWKQYTQRVALVEVREAGPSVADGETDLGEAGDGGKPAPGGRVIVLAQYPSASPSLRGSEPPINTPRS